MTNERSCPCRLGVFTVTSTGIAPFPRKFKLTRLLLSFALVFGVMLFANAPSAFAQQCQASGALPMATSSFNLVAGQTKTITVSVINTSATVEAVPVAVTANLTGTTVVKLNCANAACTIPFATAPLTFVSVGANGCVANDPGVTSCTAGAGNTVNININSIPLAANTTPKFVATIQVQATTPSTCAGNIFEPGGTGPSDIVTTSADCDPQVAGGAQGSTAELFPIVCPAPTECQASNVCNPDTNTCVPTNDPPSTTCTDTDNNACTTAGCDGNGACNQNHVVKTCEDLECTTGICDPATGNCGNEPSSTECADTDGNVCTTPGCDGLGACNQRHVLPNSTTCPDTDDNECTTAGCDGAGGCNQNHIQDPDSTPCTDTDGLECTVAGCPGAGASCNQTHIDNCQEGQGCTPGFWKNNFDKKGGNAWPVPLNTKMFGPPPAAGFVLPASCPELSSCANFNADTTLRQALGLQGGDSLCEKAEILLRHAAAAFLNASSSCVFFDLTPAEVVAQVNAALASCDPAAIITLATELDRLNNQGCPLNQQGECSNPQP